jgi:pectinesterase inhibitor-like protein
MVRFSFLPVVFLLCVASSYATNIVDVQAICKKAKNPSFCLNLLNSKPGGAGGDLVSLASYTLGVVRADVSNTITLLTKLIEQSGSDPKKQDYYKNCLSNFGMDEGALGEVTEAQQLLKDFDYNGVNVHMSSVMTYVDDCLSGDSSPIKDTSLLPKYADVVDQVAQIILIISNMLQS